MAIDIREAMRERKLDRMRLGQTACDFATLPSDPETRMALVPISDADRLNALTAAAMLDAPDNVAGIMARDHIQKVELLAVSLRDPQDLTVKLYRDAKDLQDELDGPDIDHLYDAYNEMTENSNPTIEGIPPEEFDVLKKALAEMDMSALSGRSWYALKRFLGVAIRDGLLRDSLRGSISNTKLITTNDSEKSTNTASQSSTERLAKSVGEPA